MNDMLMVKIDDSDKMLAYCLSCWKQSFEDYFPELDDMENGFYPSGGTKTWEDLEDSIDKFYVSAVNGVMDSWAELNKSRYCLVIKISLGMEPMVYHFKRQTYAEVLQEAQQEMKIGLRKRNVVI